MRLECVVGVVEAPGYAENGKCKMSTEMMISEVAGCQGMSRKECFAVT